MSDEAELYIRTKSQIIEAISLFRTGQHSLTAVKIDTEDHIPHDSVEMKELVEILSANFEGKITLFLNHSFQTHTDCTDVLIKFKKSRYVVDCLHYCANKIVY